MTHLIGSRAPALHQASEAADPPEAPVAPVVTVGLAAGVAAALAGLALTAVPLLLLWIVSPYIQNGAVGSLHLAACLWLLAHGADLVRVTGSGPAAATAPVGIAPLLLTAAVLTLLHRAGKYTGRALRTAQGDPSGGPLPVRGLAAALLAVSVGYTTAAAVAVALASGNGVLRARPLPALGAAAVVAVIGAAAGLRSAARPGPPHPSPLLRLRALLNPYGEPSGQRAARRLPAWAFPPDALSPVLRAAAAAWAALLGVGAVVFGIALLMHGNAAGRTVLALAPDVPGQIGLLLLCLALYPDAVVWASAYALGPGFTLGTGSTVAPHGTVLGDTPVLPLLAALPDPDAPGGAIPLGLVALALPPLAGAALAAVLGRAAARDRWHPTATAVAAVAAALATGFALAACAAASGGALGTDRLASLGPRPWQSGLAAAAWSTATGVPGTLLARFLLRSRPAPTVTPRLGLFARLRDLSAGRWRRHPVADPLEE
ncbi:DUF6350 family protein [Peterkaempfera bronchialis]|uniref:cell division protein PerM n=1 Tax=Peterkaempfera bronchialis TaxID=2126346 RepID=UPI003C2E7C9B